MGTESRGQSELLHVRVCTLATFGPEQRVVCSHELDLDLLVTGQRTPQVEVMREAISETLKYEVAADHQAGMVLLPGCGWDNGELGIQGNVGERSGFPLGNRADAPYLPKPSQKRPRFMQIISLDRDVPEVWNIGPAARALAQGELVIVPTDTIYAICCDPWDAGAVGRMYAAKGMDKSKRCAVACRDLKDIGAVGRAVGDAAFRFIKSHLPGPYTVLLNASWELPRRATGSRKQIGVRIPDHVVCQALAEDFGRPLLVTSLPAWEDGGEIDPVEAAKRLYKKPAVILDQGPQLAQPSTVVDFTVDPPELIRQGQGELDILLD